MVARVDRALKDDLGIADGLAADNVYVLDPCCGTGAYLAETLRRIAANLEGKGLGALAGARVKQAATQRVFGFEIMPAPLRRRPLCKSAWPCRSWARRCWMMVIANGPASFSPTR